MEQKGQTMVVLFVYIEGIEIQTKEVLFVYIEGTERTH